MISGNMVQALMHSAHFAVEINGFDAALFSKATLPSSEFEEVTFSPAGSMFDQKAPGRIKFEDVTLERGIEEDGADKSAYEWLTKQIDVNAATGALLTDFLKDIDIVQYNRSGDEVRRWSLKGAWVKKLEYSDLEGKSSENVIETLTIAYQYFEIA